MRNSGADKKFPRGLAEQEKSLKKSGKFTDIKYNGDRSKLKAGDIVVMQYNNGRSGHICIVKNSKHHICEANLKSTYGITVKTAGKDNITVTNCYGKSGKVSDATDASGMSNEVLQASLGSGWEIVEGDVVPKSAPTSIFNPVFNAVVISKNNTPVTSKDGNVELRGNYDPVVLPGDDVSNLYLGSGNNLFWPVKDKTINAFRAYFHVNLGPEQMVRNIVTNLDGFGPTAVEEIRDSRFKIQDSGDAAWYDLSGRKYTERPTKPGIYVHNGQKIVVN